MFDRPLTMVSCRLWSDSASVASFRDITKLDALLLQPDEDDGDAPPVRALPLLPAACVSTLNLIVLAGSFDPCRQSVGTLYPRYCTAVIVAEWTIIRTNHVRLQFLLRHSKVPLLLMYCDCACRYVDSLLC